MQRAMSTSSIAVILVAALAAAACDGKRTPAPAPQPSSVASVISAAPPNAPNAVAGSVLETMDAGGYTYLRLSTPGGEKWAAVQQAKVAVGDKVTITGVSLMTGFASPTLKRTFDEIYFGTLDGQGAKGGPTAPGGSSLLGASPAPATPVAAVAKAAGPTGRTVAEIWANKTTLKDKPVAVRGTVVKFNAGILGKNWIHLQDRSPSTAPGDNDITVTTSATTAVGDVIVVRGITRTDKDFGSGYTYPVLVEDATIEKDRATP
jgi:hypothetical protein